MLDVWGFMSAEGFEGLSAYWYGALFLASLCGGFVGSFSGGAGMITLPFLLLSGIEPLYALATNKIQACFGSLTSATHYYKQGLVDTKALKGVFVISIVASALGAMSAYLIPSPQLSIVLPFIMMIIGLYFLLAPHISDEDKADSLQGSKRWYFYASLSVVAFYGGLMGAGVGSLVLALLVALGGYGLSRALGLSRWVVFSINVISAVILSMNALWILAVVMIMGQVIGSHIGARLAIKHGATIIRPMVILLCLGISAYLFIQELL